MTRRLPVPLLEPPEPVRYPAALRDRARDAAAWLAPLVPVFGQLVQRLVQHQSAPQATSTRGFVLVESLSIRILERADGTRQWELEHVTMEKPRRRWLPGRWLLALSCLSALAWAVTRSARLDRPFE